MAYKVYSDKDISQKEWNILTGNSFFASTQFASLWRAKKGEPLYYLDEEDGKIKAGIGGIVFGKGLLKRYDSMPDGLYGGPYFTPDYNIERQQKFFTSFEKYIKQNNFIRANINKPSVNFNSDMFKIQTAFEHVLELSESKYVPSRKEIRKNVRGSQKRGVRIELLESLADIERLHDLAKASAKRYNQKFVYSKEFYYGLLKTSVGNKNILLLKAMLEDRMIASQISFIEGQKILNWHFYFDNEYRYYKPGYLLVDYLLDYSFKNGLKYFNMGSTPGKTESVTKHKERWGCKEQSYNNYVYQSFLGKLICGWRRR